MTDARQKEWETTLNQADIDEASVDGHLLRRAVTLGVDQVLRLNRDGDLRVWTNEYSIIKSHGDYWCSCGVTFDDDIEAAHQHLLEVWDGDDKV